MANKVNLALILVLAVGVAYLGYDYGRDRQLQKTWSERDKAAQIQLADKDRLLNEKDVAIEAVRSVNKILEREVAEHDARIVQLEKDNARIKENLSIKEAQLRTLPAEDIVASLQRNLNTKEIWLEATLVKFSISAAVEAAVRIDRERVLTLEYIPGIEKANAELHAEVGTLKELVKGKDKDIGLMTEKFTLMSEKYTIQEKNFADYKKLKEKSLFAKVGDFALKFGIGFAVGHFTK